MKYLVETLRQDSPESLQDYYRRAEDLLHALGGRDDIGPAVLSVNERSILSRVISRFVAGLDELYMEPDVSPDRDSLRQTYVKIREAECLM